MLNRYVINLLRIFVFYILLFALFRVVFLLYFFRQVLYNNNIGIFFRSLYEALPLDISSASYLMYLPLLILFFANIFYSQFLIKLLKAYILITTTLCAIISVVEIGVYHELQMKLYYNLVLHLQHIDEAFRSTPIKLAIIVVALFFVLSWVCFLLFKKFAPSVPAKDKPADIFMVIKNFVVLSLGMVLLVLGSRGGLQEIPINEGEAYFCDNQCVNDATVNPFWNLLHSFIENKVMLRGDAYKVMDDKEAAEIVHNLYAVKKDTTIHLFKIKRPNVCILILESWTSDLVRSLGGYDSLSPNFEKLIKDGYLFTRIKPSGHVSDQGVPAILSGYPALPMGSVINEMEKQGNLPTLNNELSQAGYFCSFFFGGQLIYGGIKTYLFHEKFDRITEQQDLPTSIPSGLLGIHDSIMLNIWRDSMNTYKEPFFTSLFTLSTHPPFDEKTTDVVHWGGDYDPFLNSLIYTDRQLGRFFEEAKKTKWYDNTVFILVADHSHGVPKEYPYGSTEFYRIPVLICGGALKDEYRGVKNDIIGSQTDIASTLLHQLGISSANYPWSKDLMNPYSRQFAYYTFHVGFGFADSTGNVIWDKLFSYNNRNTGKTDAAKKLLSQKGSAMLQMEMKDFLSK